MSEPLLRARGLAKEFPVRSGVVRRATATVQAVDGVDLDVGRGTILGLLGESGSGKSTLGRMIVRLLEPTAGFVELAGENLVRASDRRLRALRRRAQIVLPVSATTLDPRIEVGGIVAEGLRIHRWGDDDTRRERVLDTLEMVGLRRQDFARYPHELSALERLRVGLARTLVLDPELIVVDEPVSDLDHDATAEILDLLKRLRSDLGLTLIVMTADPSVAELICDRVAVMYLGKVVEVADRGSLFGNSRHPYTEALLSASPVPDHLGGRVTLAGEALSSVGLPVGCRFHPRCPIAEPGRCDQEVPELLPVEGALTHTAACFLR